MADSPATTTRPEAPYTPTDSDRAVAQRLADRRAGKSRAPRYKVRVAKGTTHLDPDHPDGNMALALLCDAFVTGEPRFAVGLVDQIANAARTRSDLKEAELNFMLATVSEIGPRDPTEALLASQMAAVHNATMMAARRLNHIETIQQQDSASNMLNKLARTFAMQVEALKRYRSSGEQKVTVNHQHVTVSARQAVVGVSQGGGDTDESHSQSHATGPGFEKQSNLPDERGPPLLGQEQAVRMPMPGTGCEGQICVQDARRQGGSAER